MVDIKECEHVPTGEWKVEKGISYAECELCGWYKTDLEGVNLSE